MLLPSTRIIQPELASNNFTVEVRQYRLHPGTAGFKNPSLLTLQRVFMAPARLPISASARLSHLWPPPTMTFEGPVSYIAGHQLLGHGFEGRKDAQQQPCIYQDVATFDAMRIKVQYDQITLPTSKTTSYYMDTCLQCHTALNQTS